MRILDLLKTKSDEEEELSFKRKRAIKMQYKTLRKLVSKGAITDYGKRYGFSQILAEENLYKSFNEKVPLTNYETLFPWWQRAYNGEHDVCWPGKVEYFALSSGTSEGASKYIPVTNDMLKSIKKASIKQIISIAKTDMPKEYLTKHYLIIAGSVDLDFNGINYSGDLSGITTQHLPFWFERFSKPDRSIREERNWESKLEQISANAKDYDVAMIAGVPAWIQILFEDIIKRYNLNNIHDIWPNLSVYIHGGVSISPYKNSLNKLLGKPIMYFETYLASEGFIGLQNKIESKGMNLLFDNGIFYEFVPFNKYNFNESGEVLDNPEVLRLEDVKEGEEYALLLTTNAGAWRYMIGDVIKFTELNLNCFIITGRTKHFLSLCGEHLSVDNMTKGIGLTANHFNTNMQEFTVKGISHKGKFAHEWFIGCEDNNLNSNQVKEVLDINLKALNDDYKTERNHALKEIILHLIPNRIFLEFLSFKGKIGAQTKFPRVLTDSLFVEWKDYLKQKEILV